MPQGDFVIFSHDDAAVAIEDEADGELLLLEVKTGHGGMVRSMLEDS